MNFLLFWYGENAKNPNSLTSPTSSRDPPAQELSSAPNSG
jgi:hypothetical protein